MAFMNKVICNVIHYFLNKVIWNVINFFLKITSKAL